MLIQNSIGNLKNSNDVNSFYFSFIKNDSEKVKKMYGKREKIKENRGKPFKYENSALKKPKSKSTSYTREANNEKIAIIKNISPALRVLDHKKIDKKLIINAKTTFIPMS